MTSLEHINSTYADVLPAVVAVIIGLLVFVAIAAFIKSIVPFE